MGKVNYGDAILKVERMISEWLIDGHNKKCRIRVITKYAVNLMRLMRREGASIEYIDKLRLVVSSSLIDGGESFAIWHGLGRYSNQNRAESDVSWRITWL
jgi:hypothetical protein